MNKIKKTMAAAAILIGTCAAPVAAFQSFGQELTNEAGETVDATVPHGLRQGHRRAALPHGLGLG